MKKKKKVHSRFNGSFSEKFAQIRKNSNFSSALKYYNQEHTNTCYESLTGTVSQAV